MHHPPTVPFARANGTNGVMVEVSLFREQDPAFGENLLALQKLFDNRIENTSGRGCHGHACVAMACHHVQHACGRLRRAQ